MSLDWKLTGIENYRDLCWQPTGETDPADGQPYVKLRAVTEAIIWGMMAIDMGTITPDNVDEVWRRLNIHQYACDGLMRRVTATGVETVWLTRADVVAHIGFRCNVTTKTAKAWEKAYAVRHWELLVGDARRAAERRDADARREAEAAAIPA